MFQRAPGGWSLRYAGKEVVGFKRVKGMDVIHTLLRNQSLPGEEPVRISSATLDDPDSEPFVDNGEPVIDLRKMKQQKQKLLEEYNQARVCQDETREAKAERDLEALQEHIRKNTDRYGRPRRLGSDAEKIRRRVLKNYRCAVKRLENVAPAFANHLRDHVHSGHWWTYKPKTDLDWQT